MARPNKYATHVAPRFGEIEDWLRNGATEAEVARNLGIAVSTFCEYKKMFSEFSEVLKKTRDVVDGEVENGNTTAQIFWLKNRRPKKWRDKQVEIEPEQEQSFVVSIEDCT